VALRTPHEPDVAEELTVRRLVLVGVPVPVGAVGPARLRLGDGPTVDADRGVRQLFLHEITLLTTAVNDVYASAGRPAT
jgi:hypothetical protein